MFAHPRKITFMEIVCNPMDSVTGYTASKLNEILLGSYGWLSLTTQLKANKPIGVTDAIIDQLMLRYGEICK
jgi:hypothetical protein